MAGTQPADSPKQQALRKQMPELAALPPDWTILVQDQTKRIYYRKDNVTTFDHPSLGPLPKPWIVRMCTNEDTGYREPRFYHRATYKSQKNDPRYAPETLKANEEALRKIHGSKTGGKKTSTEISGAIRKLRKGEKIEEVLIRPPIGNVNIQDKYDYLHAIDAGGEIGGMNGGVFVVRLKGTNQLFIEKRFKPADRKYALKEIKLLHRLVHSALTFYNNGFITDTTCAVYMEFCDRGSLKDMIKTYGLKRASTPEGMAKPHIPEKFLWHCFVGLCDALAFLRTGLSFARDGITDPNKKRPDWIPILHRDIKPDNILLRSRATSGDSKYFYCCLSDFGLACPEYPSGHPEQDEHQKTGAMLGTGYWMAPELCHNPYPKTKDQFEYFPARKGHTEKSDLWALATIIFDMAECDNFAHLHWDKRAEIPDGDARPYARMLHKQKKEIKTYYSEQLRKSILDTTEWDPKKRPTATEAVVLVNRRCKAAGYEDVQPKDESEQLPSWATRVHEYHSRPAKRAEDFLTK